MSTLESKEEPKVINKPTMKQLMPLDSFDTILSGSATQFYDPDNPVFQNASELTEAVASPPPPQESSDTICSKNSLNGSPSAQQYAVQSSLQLESDQDSVDTNDLPSTEDWIDLRRRNEAKLKDIEDENFVLKKQNLALSRENFEDWKLRDKLKHTHDENQLLLQENKRLRTQLKDSKKKCETLTGSSLWKDEEIERLSLMVIKLKHDLSQATGIPEDEESESEKEESQDDIHAFLLVPKPTTNR